MPVDQRCTHYEALERERVENTLKLERERMHAAQNPTSNWAMMGETGSGHRPVNALLDETLDIEYATKPVPLTTEQHTRAIEDVILNRIANSQYDSRVPVDPLHTHQSHAGSLSSLLDSSKTLPSAKLEIIEAQKSKHSLMDLYEKDYLEKMKEQNKDTELGPGVAGNFGKYAAYLLHTNKQGEDAHSEALTDVQRDEIRALVMWKKLAQHLDALSNFHFTPKPIVDDSSIHTRSIENRAPAIAIEPVGIQGFTAGLAPQTAVNGGAMLAPQDIHRGHKDKFTTTGTNELLPRERKALRRAKKQAGASKKERLDYIHKKVKSNIN